MPKCQRYLIERSIPGIGAKTRAERADASTCSCAVLHEMHKEGKHIHWEHSYVTDDTTLCIYVTDDESLIWEHAKRSGPWSRRLELREVVSITGFSATKVTVVRSILDPTTNADP